MKALVELVAEWDAGAPLAGASASAIDMLAAAAPQPLPADYVAFLAAAGATPRGIFAARHDLTPEALTAFHRRADWTPPPGYLAIGIDREGTDRDLYLGAAGTVVELPRWSDDAASLEEEQYESLARMLFSQAFYNVRLPRFPRRAVFAQIGPDAPLETVHALAAELQLPPVPHTGGYTLCFEGGDLALLAYRPPARGVYLEAAAIDDGLLAPLQRVLERMLPVRRTR